MKLLITTQVVDSESPTLSFFHRWIEELSQQYESIEVICLYEGMHSLPKNVHVHSLGKEKIPEGKEGSRLKYVLRLKSLTFKLRREYDAVFVHMNQEYILVAGPMWKLLGKRVYLWRNHYAGSWLTDVAALFCTKVFCTSKHSYTAKYKNAVLMPVGVDVERFVQDPSDEVPVRAPHSILFLARMAPSKRPELLLEALNLLEKKGVSFSASFYGSPLAKDAAYYESIKEKALALGLGHQVKFYEGVTNEAAAKVFRAHEIFVNCSTSGMFDKMLFEAAASGCLVLAESKDFAELAGDVFEFSDVTSLVNRLEALLSEAPEERDAQKVSLYALAQQQSLTALVKKLQEEMK